MVPKSAPHHVRLFSFTNTVMMFAGLRWFFTDFSLSFYSTVQIWTAHFVRWGIEIHPLYLQKTLWFVIATISCYQSSQWHFLTKAGNDWNHKFILWSHPAVCYRMCLMWFTTHYSTWKTVVLHFTCISHGLLWDCRHYVRYSDIFMFFWMTTVIVNLPHPTCIL